MLIQVYFFVLIGILSLLGLFGILIFLLRFEV